MTQQETMVSVLDTFIRDYAEKPAAFILGARNVDQFRHENSHGELLAGSLSFQGLTIYEAYDSSGCMVVGTGTLNAMIEARVARLS